jgi:hypothetical protein
VLSNLVAVHSMGMLVARILMVEGVGILVVGFVAAVGIGVALGIEVEVGTVTEFGTGVAADSVVAAEVGVGCKLAPLNTGVPACIVPL